MDPTSSSVVLHIKKCSKYSISPKLSSPLSTSSSYKEQSSIKTSSKFLYILGLFVIKDLALYGYLLNPLLPLFPKPLCEIQQFINSNTLSTFFLS